MPRRALERFLQEKAVSLLLVFNGILLVASWVMSIVAFPNLPAEVPRMIDFLGRPLLAGAKSPAFFLAPALQSGLFALCAWAAGRLARRGAKAPSRGPILQEAVYLGFIFVQLLFIHGQRTLIYLAHGIDRGFNPVYFYALFLIILALFPYFRLRLKIRD